MSKTTPTLLSVSMLLIVILACATPGVPTSDPNFINTAIEQTFAAALSQTAQPEIPVTGQTATATKPLSPTPFPTFTLVVIGRPEVRVSVDTNCRTGPSEIYDRVRVLRVDEVAEVVGRSADGNYWVIRNPDRPGEVCWLSGENATLTGMSNILPVFTPPPTPTPTNTRVPLPTPTRTRTPSPTPTRTRTPLPTSTPSRTPTRTPTPSSTSATPTSSSTFTPTTSSTSVTSTSSPTFTPTLTPTPTASPTFTPTLTPTLTASPTFTPTPSPTFTSTASFTNSYNGMESCTGTGWWVEIQLNNTGGISFESMTLILSDTVTGTLLPLYSDEFTNRDGCSVSDTQSNLPPGATRIVSSPVFAYDPTGHNLRATIIVCANAGQSGTCKAQAINFTP